MKTCVHCKVCIFAGRLCRLCWEDQHSTAVQLSMKKVKCRRAFMSEVPCDKDGTFRDDCCKTHWLELEALQAPIRERSYNERKDAWSVD